MVNVTINDSDNGANYDASFVIDIELLTSHNYQLWSETLCLVLRSKGIWKYAEGTAGTMNDKAAEADKERWDQENAAALLLILTTVDDTQSGYLAGIDTAMGAWAKLKALHQPITTNLYDLFSRYTRNGKSNGIDATASKLTQLQSQLTAIDPSERRTEVSLSVRLFASLSPEYEPAIKAFNRAKNLDFSLDEVVNCLRQIGNELDYTICTEGKVNYTKGGSSKNCC
jgi:gag-polypeptide of LTR copia-type